MSLFQSIISINSNQRNQMKSNIKSSSNSIDFGVNSIARSNWNPKETIIPMGTVKQICYV